MPPLLTSEWPEDDKNDIWMKFVDLIPHFMTKSINTHFPRKKTL